MYDKLAGMTGTALTEADELFDIYKLEVVEIPTNVQVARLDEDDEVYRTQTEKYAAILAEVERANSRLQPVGPLQALQGPSPPCPRPRPQLPGPDPGGLARPDPRG